MQVLELLLWCVLFRLQQVNARALVLPWARDIATATVNDGPFQTIPGFLEPTPFNVDQSIVNKKLGKRDAFPETVCGFIGGTGTIVALCKSTSVCVWDTIHNLVGCSNTRNGYLAVYSTCFDANNREDRVDSPYAYTCPGDEECFRNTYDPINGYDFYQWGCGKSSMAGTVLSYPTGVTETKTIQVILTGLDLPAPTTSTTTTTTTTTTPRRTTTARRTTTSSADDPEPTDEEDPDDVPTNPNDEDETTTSPSPSRTTADRPDSPSNTEDAQTTSPNETTTVTAVPIGSGGSKTNVGAIAGGAAGGVLALIALAAGLFFFFRRRRRQQNPGDMPPVGGAPNAAFTNAPPQPPPPPTGGNMTMNEAFVPAILAAKKDHPDSPVHEMPLNAAAKELDAGNEVGQMGPNSGVAGQRWSELSGDTVGHQRNWSQDTGTGNGFVPYSQNGMQGHQRNWSQATAAELPAGEVGRQRGVGELQ